MASRLATNFRKSAEGGVTTYSFTDIAEGTGIIVFYGADTNDNGTRSYFLTTNAVYSDKILTYGNGTSGTEKVLDLDFDTPALNLPKNVKGTFRAAIPLIVGHETNANVTGEVYAVVKLRKVSGGVETEIASNTSSTDVIEDDGTDSDQGVVLVEIPITSVTHFKKGDKIRVTIEVWAKNQGASGTKLGIFHDPKNRSAINDDPNSPLYYPGASDAGDFITSVLEVHIPFVLDL